MKTAKLYEIRINGNSLSMKLRTYSRARRLAGYLRSRYGIDTYLAPWMVAAKACAQKPRIGSLKQYVADYAAGTDTVPAWNDHKRRMAA